MVTTTYRIPGVKFVRVDYEPAKQANLDDRTIFVLGHTAEGDLHTPIKVKSYEDFVTSFGVGAGKSKKFSDWMKVLFDFAPRDVYVVRVESSGATPSHTEVTKGLASLSTDYGPGTLIVPSLTDKKIYQAVGEHCVQNNRIGILDVPEDARDKTALLAAVTQAKTITDGKERVMVTGPWLSKGDGTVPASIFAAAQTSKLEASDNIQPVARQVPPAQAGWTGVKLTDAEATELYRARLMLVSEKPVGTTLDGYLSLAEDEGMWADLAGARLYMALEARIKDEGRQYIGSTVTTGTIAKWHGALSNLLAEVHARGGLYGTPNEAFKIETASVNTAETAANRELHARVAVRVAEHVQLVITTALRVPVTEQIPA